MPKRVDHGIRRRQIAEAVWRIAAAHGLETVSIRNIAAEAGMSSPLIQRYFPDKETLLRHALTELDADAQRHSEQRVVAAVSRDGSDLSVTLPALLAEFLPLDEQRRTLLLVRIAFFTRGLADPGIATMYRDDLPALNHYVSELLRTAQEAGTVVSNADCATEADTLITLAVGCGTDMLAGLRTADQATALFGYHLTRLGVIRAD